MKEVLLNPGFLALLGVIFTGLLAHLQFMRRSKDSFTKSNLTTEEKKLRALRWYQENYHKARMLGIQNGLGELVEKHLPFEPPQDLMIDNARSEENTNGGQ